MDIPLRMRASGAAGPRAPTNAGACQAPQTTATRSAPSFNVFRSTCRIYASRCAVSSSIGTVSRSASIASVIASKESAPELDSITESHQRSVSSKPAAAASSDRGSPSRYSTNPLIRQHVERGQIAEPCLHTVLRSPLQRLPFR